MTKYVFVLPGVPEASEFDIPEGITEHEVQMLKDILAAAGTARTGSGLALLHFEALELG